MLVRKTNVVPIECVVRGYLSGRAGRNTSRAAACAALSCRRGCSESEQLPEPIFTPATKAEIGHDDEHLVRARCADSSAGALAEATRASAASTSTPRRRASRSSRESSSPTRSSNSAWLGRRADPDRRSADARQLALLAGRPVSAGPVTAVVRQAVRARLAGNDRGWDKNSPPPALPTDVVRTTRAKYIEAFERLTGEEFPWK